MGVVNKIRNYLNVLPKCGYTLAEIETVHVSCGDVIVDWFKLKVNAPNLLLPLRARRVQHVQSHLDDVMQHLLNISYIFCMTNNRKVET